MTPSGTIADDGRTLSLVRHLRAPIEDVWASVVESDRLQRWYGTWTGNPADGHVLVTMNAEDEPVPAVRHEIVACEPPQLLTVTAVDESGGWHLSVELQEADGITELTLRQHDITPDAVADLGPGWEWYLDRLVAAVTEQPVPDLAAFEDDYRTLASGYAALAAAHSAAGTGTEQ